MMINPPVFFVTANDKDKTFALHVKKMKRDIPTGLDKSGTPTTNTVFMFANSTEINHAIVQYLIYTNRIEVLKT